MSDVEVNIVIDRTPSQVWAYVENISSHVDWMVDAADIRFLTDQQHGPGTTFECDTVVGPLRLTDEMAVTSWVPESEMGVKHQGAVTGVGVFRLKAIGDDQTEFSWRETLTFPWWMAGPLGARVAKPVLAAIWRRNLKTLKQRVEAL